MEWNSTVEHDEQGRVVPSLPSRADVAAGATWDDGGAADSIIPGAPLERPPRRRPEQVNGSGPPRVVLTLAGQGVVEGTVVKEFLLSEVERLAKAEESYTGGNEDLMAGLVLDCVRPYRMSMEDIASILGVPLPRLEAVLAQLSEEEGEPEGLEQEGL